MKLVDILARLRGSSRTLTLANERGAETVRTFDQLHADVLSVVERMQALGVSAGCRVGIAAPSHYAWIVWDLACIELGCVSLALPNERPQRDLAEVIEAYQLTLLAADAGWIGAAAGHERIVDADPAAPRPAHRVGARPLQHPPGTHSLVFSSGTTGKAKGLVIGAAGTEHLQDLYLGAFGVEPGERFLTFLPFANYQQRMIYYFCLYHGVDFVSVPFPLLFTGLKKHRPTFVIAAPILYETLVNLTRASAGPQAAQDMAALAAKLRELTGGRMRYMITGMAPIKRAALDFFWACGLPLYEAFGITEAGMVAWNKPGHVRVGSVGQPAEPGSVSLSDEGEVIVTRKALLSLGYFESSDDDLRATFVGPNAVATGDVAAFDADGYLHMVGRKKDAIITKNGEKFHPEPIEQRLQADPRVGAAVVLASDRAGVAAVISTRQHDDPDATAGLREHVSAVNRELPAQQQIRQVVFTGEDFTVDNGLRTRNLKLNRKAIAAAFLADA